LTNITMVGTSSTGQSQKMAMDSQMQLGKYEFLKILAAELANQDPTNPTDNKDFIAQLAQFSSLEQMYNMSEGLYAMGENLGYYLAEQRTLNNSLMVLQSANLIGKRVVATVDGKQIDGQVESVQVENLIPVAMVNDIKVPIGAIKYIYPREETQATVVPEGDVSSE
jgi:flagellar basal-body rod modification protein FlgD